MPTEYAFLPLIISVIVIMLMFLKHGFKDPLFLIAFFYFYFAFGPVFNWLVGNQIYAGIIKDQILNATLVFMLALISMYLVSVLQKPRLIEAEEALTSQPPGTLYPALWIVFALLAGYGLISMALSSRVLFAVSKHDRIEALGTGLHYNYLLLQFMALSCYFAVRNSRPLFRLYLANFAVYILYCLFSLERDALLVIISILLHTNLRRSGQIRRNIALLLFSGIMAMGATYLFVIRGNPTATEIGLTDFLNQGSLLFINTQILNLMDKGYPFQWGQTYLNSILNLLPSWIYSTDFYLLDWFKNLYAPGNRSGYGFAIDAEAFLNFGYVGVVITYTLVAVFQRFVFNRLRNGQFYIYFSVFFTGFAIYSARSDSLALMKGCLYAALFFGLISLVSHMMIRIEEKHGYYRYPREPVLAKRR